MAARVVWAWLAAIFSRGLVLLALVLDGIGAGALAFADFGAFTIWWPLLAIIALIIALIASFLAYAEERGRNEHQIIFEIWPSETYAQRKGDEIKQHPVLAIRALGDTKQSHFFSPFRLRIVNHHPQHDIKVVVEELIWEQKRLFRKNRRLGRLPLVSVGGELQSEWEIAVAKADRSDTVKLIFETTCQGTPHRIVPRKSHLVMRPDVLGAASGDVVVCNVRNPKGLSWRFGRHEISIRESIRINNP